MQNGKRLWRMRFNMCMITKFDIWWILIQRLALKPLGVNGSSRSRLRWMGIYIHSSSTSCKRLYSESRNWLGGYFLTSSNDQICGYVKFGDVSKVIVEGKGLILFVFKNGENWLLQNVYHIPDLCSNIINLGQLAQNSIWIMMRGMYFWIPHKKGRLIWR